MDFDAQRYREQVLHPVLRAGGTALPNLFDRYGFTSELPAEPGFSDQIARVVREWQALRAKPGWGVLIGKLTAAHKELDSAGALTVAAFQARHRMDQRNAAHRLAAVVQDENATHVGPSVVSRLRRAVGDVSVAQVRQALADAGITVVDPLPELPVTGPPGYADLDAGLRFLDLRLSAEVIFGPDVVHA
jgi:hypothetical protein